MKRLFFTILLGIYLLSSVQQVLADVWVNGYTKSDGSYVPGYYRSDPDGNPYNNWSYPGNTNPYTGETAGGDSLPSVSTAGVDMDSQVMKDAQAKYEEACDSSAGFNGGAQAANCRSATVEWLNALSKAPKLDTSSSDDYESRSSNNTNEDLDEWTQKLLSDYGITNNDSQSKNLCVERGVPNSHQEGNYCICDEGYLNTGKACVPLTIKNCEALNGKGAMPSNDGSNLCRCGTGYKLNSSRTGCVSLTRTTSESETYPPFTQLTEGLAKNVSSNFEVKSEDILSLNMTGNTNTQAKLRKCPSTQCLVIGAYPKTTTVEITGEYKKDSWYRVNVDNLKTGWIYKSLIDETSISTESRNSSTSSAKTSSFDFNSFSDKPLQAQQVESVQKPEKISWLKKVLNWFGF